MSHSSSSCSQGGRYFWTWWGVAIASSMEEKGDPPGGRAGV